MQLLTRLLAHGGGSGAARAQEMPKFLSRNAVVVLVSGFLIDKLGNRICIFVFSTCCVIGSIVFAVGSILSDHSYVLPVLLLGRLVFGAGNGSLTIVQGRISAFWFKNKELAMAFGTTLAISRLGSVLNFFLTPTLANKIGLQWTLWFGAFLCVLGFVAAIAVSALDVYGVHKLGLSDAMRQASRRVRVSDVRHFSLSFWLIVFTIMFFYNGVFPFVADASKFIQDKYKMAPTTASYLAGAVYDASMILSPFLGRGIDSIGYRGWISCGCAILSIPVFGILAFTYVYPLVATLWFGITYSFAAATMWSSIPLLVNEATIGTALGLTTCVQMIGIGICNIVVGVILGTDQEKLPIQTLLLRWKYVMIFLLANLIACVLVTIFLNIIQKRTNGVLNLNKDQLTGRHRALVTPVVEDFSDGQETDADEDDAASVQVVRDRSQSIN